MFHRQNSVYDIKSEQPCRWLFKHPTYQAWETSSCDSPFLVIKGAPGTGKSVGIKHAFEHLVARIGQGSQEVLAVAHFFDGRHDTAGPWNSRLGMYRAILYQLLQHLPSLSEAFLENHPKGKRAEWTPRDFRAAIRSILTTQHEKPRAVFLFIDAVDESNPEEAGTILTDLQELSEEFARIHLSFQICLSVRQAHRLEVSMPLKAASIEVESCNTDDIRLYVKSELSRFPRGKDWTMLEHALLDKAMGVFQWVHLIVEKLKVDTALEMDELLCYLNDLPETLMKLYAHLLGEAKVSRQSNELLRLLQLLLVAREPLRLIDAQYALALGPDSDVPEDWESFARRMIAPHQFLKRLTAISHGLIQVDGVYGATSPKETPDHSSCVVHFLHQTVRDFLLSDQGLASLSSTNTVDTLAQCHHTWHRICMVALDIPSPDTASQCLSRLSHYAARFWMGHAREADSVLVSHTHDHPKFIRKCLKSRTAKMVKMYREHVHLPHMPLRLKGEEKFFVLLAAEGCSHLLTLHIRECQCHSRTDEPPPRVLDRALYHACANKRLSVIKVLSALGCDLNAIISHNTALYHACSKGALEVVQLLLELGANAALEAPRQDYGLPLGVAVAMGHRKVVDELLKCKETTIELVQLRNKSGHTALHYAAFHRHSWAVRKLIDAFDEDEDDINAYLALRSDESGTAMDVAKSWKYHDIVRVLQQILNDVC